jgi:hypothetical protein
MVRPVFVCGTGRSGTSVVARMLGWHRAVSAIPFELRFHVAGLLDVAEGALPAAPFVAKVWRRWYRADMVSPSGEVKRTRGLSFYFDVGELTRLLDLFAAEAEGDPHSAARRLLRAVLERAAAHGTGRVVVEHSPANGRVADRLARLVPEARFLAVVRDGRDVAASVATKRFGPDDPLDALWFWADRHREITMRLRTLPADRTLTVDLLDLVTAESDAALDRLLEFIGVGEDPYARAFLNDAMGPEAASVGRWQGLPARLRDAIDTAYREITEWCEADGIPMPRPGG